MRKILLLSLLTRLIFVFGPFHPDLGNHLDWGDKFWQYGPKKFYEQSIWGVSWPNQPPGTIYLWGLVSKVDKIIFNFFWWLNLKFPAFPSFFIPFLEQRLYPALVKLPSVLAEVGIGWLIYLMVKKIKDRKAALWASLIFLFNPITIYNSSIWGQTDGLINFLGLLAIYLLLNKKPILGISFFILSFYFKASLIIFFPIILILFLRQKNTFRNYFLSLIIPIAFIALITLPFVAQNHVFKWLSDLYRVRVFGHQGNMLSGNAFNLWTIIFGIDLAKTDSGEFLWLSFKQTGQLLFFLSLIPIVWRLIFVKPKSQNYFFSLALVGFSAFLFLTNMHERYLYPIFPYLAILVGLELIPLWLYIIVSLIHLLNLYNLWYYPYLGFLKIILSWQNFLLVRVFSGVLILVFFWLYYFFFRAKSGKIKAG